MAYQNKTIYNPKAKQLIRFLQTGSDTSGTLLEMEAVYSPNSKEPPMHYHPHQTEDFELLSGELTIKIHGQVIKMEKGDRLHIPANTLHSMWNNSNDPAVLNWQVRPALQTEHLLETLAGLATDGKTNESGAPSLLQAALIANRFSDVMRLAKPAFLLQKALFTLLAPISYCFGLRPVYDKYID